MIISYKPQTGEITHIQNHHAASHPLFVDDGTEKVVNYDTNNRPAEIEVDLSTASVGDHLEFDDLANPTRVTRLVLNPSHRAGLIHLVEESKHDSDDNSTAIDALAQETCAIVDQRVAETAEGSDARTKWNEIKAQCTANHEKRNYYKFARQVEAKLEPSVEMAFDERATTPDRHWDADSTPRILAFLKDFAKALRDEVAIQGKITDKQRDRFLDVLTGRPLVKGIITQSADDVAESAGIFADAVRAQDIVTAVSINFRVAVKVTLDGGDEIEVARDTTADYSLAGSPIKFAGGYSALPVNRVDSVVGERVMTIRAAANATLTLTGAIEATIQPSSVLEVRHEDILDQAFTLTASVPAPAILEA